MDYEALAQQIKRNKFLPQPPSSRIFTGGDASDFLQIGTDIVRSLIQTAGATPSAKLLEVGSGIGRAAIPLTQYLSDDGHYTGTDIVLDGVSWCNENIGRLYPNFRFVHHDIYNEFYNPSGQGTVEGVNLPSVDGGYDIIFLASVFTHLTRADVESYLPRMHDVLAPGGRLWGTWFIVDEDLGDLVLDGRSKVPLFPKADDGVYYSTADKGTGAVAYDKKMILDMLGDAGFDVEYVQYGEWCAPRSKTDGGFQDLVVAVKR